ncbi:MarR family transcriptional regulator [Thiomicrorhabdus hydrogeniphila]
MISDNSSLENLFQLVHALKRQLHQQTDQLNVDIAHMHIRVIKVIDKKQPCTANDIIQFLGRDKAQVTRLINMLIEKGLITKEINPNDKRSQYLNTTQAGVDILNEIKEIDSKTVQIMSQGLTPHELEEFQRISQIITKNLSSDLN